MIVTALGVAVGLLIAFGPLSFLKEPTEKIIDSLMNYSFEASTMLVNYLPKDAAYSKAVEVLQISLAVILPGLVALILVVAAKGAGKIRRLISSLLLVAAFSSFIFLPGDQALLLSICAILMAGLLSLASGILLQIPLLAVATVMGTIYVTIIFNGTMSALSDGALKLTLIAEAGPGGFSGWLMALMVLGLTPFAAAVTVAFREAKKK